MGKEVVCCYNKGCEDWSDDPELMTTFNYCQLYIDITKGGCRKEILEEVMDKRRFEVGDKVRLTSGNYSDHPMNPFWGKSQGSVVGTVIEPESDSSMPLRVDWGTGNINSYNYGDLSLHETKQGGSGSMKKMVICPKGEAGNCSTDSCSHKIPHKHKGDSCSDSGGACPACVPCEKSTVKDYTMDVVTKAKGIATSIRTTIKPYEKYLGLVVLALVIDHFLLDGKFAHKFKELAEIIVTKIQSGLDKMTEKLTGEWFTDGTDGEDK